MDCFVASLPCANASRLSQAMTARERSTTSLPFLWEKVERERRHIRARRCVTSCVTARRANHSKPVQPSHKKYSASRSPQITPTTPAIPRPQEGRIAIVTDVGCGERWPRHAGRATRLRRVSLLMSEGADERRKLSAFARVRRAGTRPGESSRRRRVADGKAV